MLQICIHNVETQDALLRRWVVLCLAKLWEDFPEAKKQATELKCPETLCGLLRDPIAEVRAAAVYALGTFIGDKNPNADQDLIDAELNLATTFPIVAKDGNPLVRRELILATKKLVDKYQSKFIIVVKNLLRQQEREAKCIL